MRTAIICYSYTNNNLLLAGDLISRTGGTLYTIEETSKRSRATIFLDLLFHRTPSIKEYLHLDNRFEHYILIAPIWGGKIATPLKAFLKKEGSKIRSYSFITLCGGGNDQRPGITKELTGLLGNNPVAVTQLSLVDLFKGQPTELINQHINREHLKHFDGQIHDFVTTVNLAGTPVVTA